jgi:hypothetical protein
VAWLLATERDGMTDKPTGAHALSGLVAKRAEVAGEIAAVREKLRQLIVDLDHVDAAIRLFDPDYDIAGIRDKPVHPAQIARRGDSIRLILDLLREATEPMTTKQIALRVMAHRGLNTMDDALVLTMSRRVGASLRSYKDNGAVRSIKDGRYGKYDLWEIAR